MFFIITVFFLMHESNEINQRIDRLLLDSY